MKAKELRIGNILTYLHEETESYYEVSAEDIQTIHDYEIDPYADQFARGYFAAGIPLTEEVLKDAGFKAIGKSKDYGKGWVIIHHRKRGWVIRKSVPIMKEFHQLQNYYFAVTGNEITIPLKTF